MKVCSHSWFGDQAVLCAMLSGVVVAADTPEGSQAVAANQRYAACLAEAGSSDKCSSSYSQTPLVLLKHKEVQSGSSSNQTVACQATGYDIHDSYAVLNQGQGDEAEEQLGSVLPSGAVVSAGERVGRRGHVNRSAGSDDSGASPCPPRLSCTSSSQADSASVFLFSGKWLNPHAPCLAASCMVRLLCCCSAGNGSGPGNQSSSLSASFMRSSTQQFRPSSMSSMRSSMAGWGGERSTFSRPASSRGSDRGEHKLMSAVLTAPDASCMLLSRLLLAAVRQKEVRACAKAGYVLV